MKKRFKRVVEWDVNYGLMLIIVLLILGLCTLFNAPIYVPFFIIFPFVLIVIWIEYLHANVYWEEIK